MHFPAHGFAEFGEDGPGEVGVEDDDHGLVEGVVSLGVFDGEAWAVEDHGAEAFEGGAVGSGVEACACGFELSGGSEGVCAGEGVVGVFGFGEDEDALFAFGHDGGSLGGIGGEGYAEVAESAEDAEKSEDIEREDLEGREDGGRQRACVVDEGGEVRRRDRGALTPALSRRRREREEEKT